MVKNTWQRNRKGYHNILGNIGTWSKLNDAWPHWMPKMNWVCQEHLRL